MHRIKPNQTANARHLRNAMTDAEQKLWQAIRGTQLGLKFRRQHPVENFIADFVCLDPKLVIEIDGGQHADDAAYDLERTKRIEMQGFKVIRFWNNEVLENLDGVLAKVVSVLALDPHPGLPPARGKEQNTGNER